MSKKRSRNKPRIIGEHFRSEGEPKRRFATREEAERFLAEYHYTHLMIYHCTFCDGFHLASER